MVMRRAAQVDANQAEIVAALRDAGCQVYIIKEPVDLLVTRCGINYLLEVKDGAKPPSQRQLTPAQKGFFAMWTGQVAVVKSVDEAFSAVGLTLALT